MNNIQHFNQIEYILSSQDIDIAFVTETWLKPEHKLPVLNKYQVHRNDRKSHAGGVAIICKNNIVCSVVSSSSSITKSATEYIVLKAKYRNYKWFYVVCVYKPNCKNIPELKSTIKQVLQVVKTNHPIIIAGDFNCDVSKYISADNKFVQYMCKSKFKQYTPSPTRMDTSVLDHVWDNSDSVCNTRVEEVFISDHKAVFFNLNFNKPPPTKSIITYRDYENFDPVQMVNDFDQIQFECNTEVHINQIYQNFISEIHTASDKHFVKKKKVVISSDRVKTRLSRETVQLMRDRDQYYRANKQNNDKSVKDKLRKMRKVISTAIRTDNIDNLNNNIREYGTWNAIKKVLPTKKSNSQTTKPENVNVNELNLFFSKLSTNSDSTATISIQKCDQYEFEFKTINSFDLYNTWRSVKHKCKATDDYCGVSLKQLSIIMPIPNVSEAICTLFNTIIVKKQIPDEMKVCTITPLVKNMQKNPNDMTNLRPINVLPELSKIFERILHHQLVQYLNRTNFFSPHQFGFKKNCSTKHVVQILTDNACKAIDNGKVYIIATIDVKSAYPSVDRNILMKKLQEAKIDSELIRSYLSNRRQRVKFENAVSNMLADRYGLPQGSSLANLFFAIYINGLTDVVLEVLLLLFADDATLGLEADPNQIDEALKTMEANVSKVITWLNKEKLQVNLGKTELMIMGSVRNLSKIGKKSINVSDATIESKECIRILGFMLDNKLTYEKHINLVIQRGYANINMVKMIRPFVNEQNCKLVIQAFVIPHVQYMITIWSTATKERIQKVDKLIKYCGRIIFNMKQRESVTRKIVQELKWLFVKELTAKYVLCDLYKLFNSQNQPEVVKDLFEPYSTTSNMVTRTKMALKSMRARTNIGERSYSYIGTKLWNDIMELPELGNGSMSYQKFAKTVHLVLANKFMEKIL